MALYNLGPLDLLAFVGNLLVAPTPAPLHRHPCRRTKAGPGSQCPPHLDTSEVTFCYGF